MKTMLIGHFMKVSLNLDYVRLDMHTVDKIRFWNSTNETTLRLVCRYGWVAMSQGASEIEQYCEAVCLCPRGALLIFIAAPNLIAAMQACQQSQSEIERDRLWQDPVSFPCSC